MDTSRSAPDTVFSVFPGSGKNTPPDQILTRQRGTARVNGPEQGYINCDRRRPDVRRRTQGRR
ncbi:MAG: hypothetical protein OXI91_14715 [Chloroflexota bacterium]|nr:hypothetical protein [Chloroflexota bacterium]